MTPDSGDACVTTPNTSVQVNASQPSEVTRGDAFPTYRRNRAQAHTHTQQPIWEDASNASPQATPKIATGKIPTWLRRHLAETGTMIEGVTRRARIHTCRKCGAAVLRGFTEEPCSIATTCDPLPLSNLGEAMALLQGRMTFDLARRAGRLELDLREQDHIQGSPPESPGWYRARSDVVAAHRCHSEPLPTIESRIPSW